MKKLSSNAHYIRYFANVLWFDFLLLLRFQVSANAPPRRGFANRTAQAVVTETTSALVVKVITRHKTVPFAHEPVQVRSWYVTSCFFLPLCYVNNLLLAWSAIRVNKTMSLSSCQTDMMELNLAERRFSANRFTLWRNDVNFHLIRVLAVYWAD